MKFANYFFLVIFLLCVAVQYNDLDPLRWMFLYGAAACCCLLFAIHKLPVYLPVATAVASFLWILLLLPAVRGTEIPAGEFFSFVHMFSPGVEEAREIGGLAIVIAWMIVLAIKTHSKIRRSVR